jgi:tRNA 2-thiouridine synthesizing protein A
MEEPDLELDCRDLLCPMPVIELARHLDEVEVGGVVAVLAHDAAARVDVPAWCRMRGQEYLGSDVTQDQVPRYHVRRTA